jgi:WD40 repeat protein
MNRSSCRFGGIRVGKSSFVLPLLATLLAPSLALADLFVVDNGSAVDRFDSSTGAVIPTQGNSTFATMDNATGVTVGPDGLVYVGGFDPTTNAVVNRFNASSGQQVGGPFISYQNGPSQLSNVQGLQFGPDGNLYAADLGDNGPLKVFDSSGTWVKDYEPSGGNAQAVAFDPALPDDVFVATGSTIESFDLTTGANHVVVQGDSNTFSDGADLAFSPGGKLYVLDTSAAAPQLLSFNADGTGQTLVSTFADAGNPNSAFVPTDMAFGPDGNLYVSGNDYASLNPDGGEILKLSPNGSNLSVFVSSLTAPGFLAFNNVPEPVVAPLLAFTALMLRRRKRN